VDNITMGHKQTDVRVLNGLSGSLYNPKVGSCEHIMEFCVK